MGPDRAPHRAAAAALLLTAALVAQAAPGDAALGAALYREGRLSSGQPLTGERGDGVQVSGIHGACINCHRASGMGGAEGSVLIPPVAGSLLFAPARPDAGRTPRRSPAMRHQDHPSRVRGAYDAATLRAALVDGHGPGGQPLGYLMPRYRLDEQELAHLDAYLRTLVVGEAEGVDPRHLHLATVLADDAPPAERRAVLDIVQHCVAERSPPGDGTTATPRPWKLHVWTLHGAPDTWAAQLDAAQRRQPVFALVSGHTGASWSPVQRFCESRQLPCVFPNTMAVDPAEPGHWTLHLSRGVGAEVAALVEHLSERAAPGAPPRLRQLVGGSESARLAARLLADQAARRGWSIASHRAADAAALEGLRPQDTLVLWLEPDALRRLGDVAPAPAVDVVLSGTLGGLESAPLPAAWRARALMLYPYEHADRRNGRIVLNAGNWMQRQGLALEPELSVLQGNTYSACEMTARALHTMRTRYSREYFMELLEASAESALATAFPRFTLGTNQRHGSRGAYLMRYDGAAGGRPHLTRASEWLVER